ncbi:dipeptidase [Thalassovita taeanensis]|uniref:Zn-dependent dipeptidase, dipeptidase homolog n=1 Tax=Thalassovita taeanensis TaxID=657014 RepID=A0A1H9KL28_9RHOB|nr:dipeptidase [Thalassovita taeanensis]SEQ99769.1 Zn-dependent dipeptidase, dipeptidase homolog [Thalassovita taeanensis]
MRTFGKWLGRLLLLALIGLVGFWVFAPALVEQSKNTVIAHEPYPVSQEAQGLHDTLVVGDWHADSLLWNRDLTERGDYGQVDLPRLREGGVAIQVFTAVTKSPAGLNYEENSDDAFDNITLLAFGQLWPVRTWQSLLQRALYQAQKLHRFERAAPEYLKIVTTRAELDAVIQARAAGAPVTAGLLGIEGAHPLEGKLENLDKLEDSGYRLIGLQHFFDNELGGSLHGQGNHGLTKFGRSVVAEVAKRGMILDVAHSSEQVTRDVLAMTDIPIVLSHTGLHSHCPVKRNFPDDLMQQIAATGGVIGMGYWAEVACDEITPTGIAKMITAAIAAVGEDHVSLGSDFDGSVETAFDTSELPALTQALLDAGLSEAQIRKVMGENMLRVLRARLN